MATAPTVPDLTKWNFTLNDTTQIIVKDNGRNAAIEQFGNSLKTMTDSINVDLNTMEGQKTATQQSAQQVAADKQTVATDKQAVASDRAHVDQQKNAIDTTAGQVSSNAQQVATDRQAVASNTQTATDAAAASSSAANASIQAKDAAEALYGDLQAVENAKTASEQAATAAGEERGLAVQAREGAETAQEAAETAAGESQGAADAAITNLKDNFLGEAAQRSVVGGTGPLMAQGYGGIGTGRRFNDINLDTLLEPGLYFVNDASTNKPPGAPGGEVIVYGGDGFICQEFTSRSGGLKAFRTKNGSSEPFGNWSVIFHSRNILSALSFSSGNPNGGIIESGFNDDGYYVRFANRTQFCRRAVSVNLAAGRVIGFAPARAFAGGPDDVSAAVSWRATNTAASQRAATVVQVTGSSQWSLFNTSGIAYGASVTAMLSMWGDW